MLLPKSTKPLETWSRSEIGRCRFALGLLVLLSSLATLLLDSSISQTKENDQPNIVVIMADDLGYGDLSCFGNKSIQTPHLDALAKSGIRFTDFHSSGAVCSPTRAGLVTGRYQQRAGIPSVIVADPKRPTHPHGLQEREITFAEQLSANGYETAIFGKWHLGYYKKYNPTKHGFSRFRGYISGNVDFFSHVDQAGRLDWWNNLEIKDEAGYTTHLITKNTIEFINKNHQKSFCLYITYEPPHYPYQGPGDKPIRTVGKPRGPAESKQSARDIQRAYKVMIEEMDKGVGQIVATLKQKNLDQKTLILFCSDNGATRHGSNGKLKGFKGQIWEGGHRVPGIACWPGTIKPGQVCHEFCTTLDIMPTILAVAGIAPSTKRPLDGLNLLPLLKGGKTLKRDPFYFGVNQARALRMGPWKLVIPKKKTKPQLFNLQSDLAEKEDLAAKEVVRVQEMRQKLVQLEKDILDDVTPQPDTPPVEK